MSQNFSWSAENYKKDVEETEDEGLIAYIKKEIEYITSKIEAPETKTLIDVGAGYGRVLPHLARKANKIINVELDDHLFAVLEQACSKYSNCTAIKGDGNNLQELLRSYEVANPVLLSLQNTLGPWIGSRNDAIDEMRKVAEPKKGEVIISVLCREAIKDWGIEMYKSVESLLGEPDLENSDLDNGVYKTKTGYESYWFSGEERAGIKRRLGGNLIGELKTHNFHIFHIKYS